MADGGMTIQIDEALADRLRGEAKAAGMPVDDYVLDILASGPPIIDRAWIDPDPAIDRRIAEEALASGDYVSLEEFERRMDRFGKPR